MKKKKSTPMTHKAADRIKKAEISSGGGVKKIKFADCAKKAADKNQTKTD